MAGVVGVPVVIKLDEAVAVLEGDFPQLAIPKEDGNVEVEFKLNHVVAAVVPLEELFDVALADIVANVADVDSCRRHAAFPLSKFGIFDTFLCFTNLRGRRWRQQ